MLTAATLLLTGVDVPQERLDAIAAVSNLTCQCIARDRIAPDAAPDAETDPARILCLLGPGTDLAQPVLWSRGVIGWVELGTLGNAALAALLRRAATAACYVSLTTATAHGIPLAAVITAVLANGQGIKADALTDVEMALHEAISNGLIHGNLQVNGMGSLDVGALDQFSNVLAARLGSPEFAGRRLEILCQRDVTSLTIEVADEGPGYQSTPSLPRGPSGRGLKMIGSVTDTFKVMEGGRRIWMRFTL